MNTGVMKFIKWSLILIKKILPKGIRQCVLDIGEALKSNFPYNKDTDINELPDDIVFGNIKIN